MAEIRVEPQRRGRGWMWLLILLLIVIIAVGWYFTSRRGTTSATDSTSAPAPTTTP
jgi:hypothetical protein